MHFGAAKSFMLEHFGASNFASWSALVHLISHAGVHRRSKFHLHSNTCIIMGLLGRAKNISIHCKCHAGLTRCRFNHYSVAVKPAAVDSKSVWIFL
uniref:Uncharacterized protein n=1 Tax=Rhipicephalus zambeziensis TaxID=60191 RepID=A0A224YDX0_9ACAR